MENTPVFVAECGSFDKDKLKEVFRRAMDEIGVTRELIEGKKVLLKPNLVLAKKPDLAATTHPGFAEAAADVMLELGASSVVLADSPGGPYNAASMAVVYRVCEMNRIDSAKVKLNDDFGWTDTRIGGVTLKYAHIINPIHEADVIVDLCKLKTHSLTGMSCATKNLFGMIPGVEKFEMHSSYPNIEDFSSMLVDLSRFPVENKTFIALCDAILSMEGNGPSHGVPKKTSLVLASRSPYALDVVAEHIMESDGTVKYLDIAAERGLAPRDYRDIPVVGLTEYPTFEFKRPDSDSGKFLAGLENIMGGRLARFFEAKPAINLKKCIGCGKCGESCPQHTIEIKTVRGKKRAVIHRAECIKCYCCQELCPIGAVDTKQNFLIKLIH